MIIPLQLENESYDIVLERGALKQAGVLLNLDRNVLVVTDDGVPASYAETVAAQCRSAKIVTIPQGEASKNFTEFQHLLSEMLQASFTRSEYWRRSRNAIWNWRMSSTLSWRKSRKRRSPRTSNARR